MQHKPLKQKQQKPKKVAHKHTKKAPHKIAKRGMKFSTLGLTRGNPVADFEQQVLPETPELETIGANTRPDGKGADVTSLFRTFDHADEQLHKVLHLTPEEFKKKFPTEESLAAWEDAVEKLDGVSQVVPTSVLMENKIQEFNESDTNHFGPAALQYNIFNEDTQFPVSKRLIGPPGTMEEPTMVFSPKPYRTVGCVGTVDNPHPLGWFSMEGYLKHMCPSCGQIFQLTNDPDECDFSYVDKVNNMTHFTGH